MGYSELLLLRVDRREPDAPILEQITKAGEPRRVLTRQLLAFSRKQVLQPVLTSTPGRDIGKDAAPLDRRRHRLAHDAGADLAGNVQADPGQIEQVL